MFRTVRSLAALAIVALTLSLLPQGAQAVEVRGGALPEVKAACQANGDGGKDDCIRHKHHKHITDHELSAGEKLTVRADLHPALHNKKLRTELQLRPLNASGKPTGPWTTQGTFAWNSQNDAASKVRRNFTVCAPEENGFYQVRKKVTIDKGAGTARDLRSGLRAGTTYTSSSTTIASNGVGCTTSPDDEELIEYFNEITFNDLIEVVFTTTSETAGTFALSCPPLDSPLPNFTLTMSTEDGSATSTCTNDTQSPAPTPISASNASCAQNGDCRFVITYSNPETGSVYSTTDYVFARPWAQNDTVIPELEPANLPLCDNTVNPCLIDGACSYSGDQYGTIQLCESATSCNQV